MQQHGSAGGVGVLTADRAQDRLMFQHSHLPQLLEIGITALFMLPGLLMTLVVSEPKLYGSAPRTLREAVVEPFHEFIHRAGWREALDAQKAPSRLRWHLEVDPLEF